MTPERRREIEALAEPWETSDPLYFFYVQQARGVIRELLAEIDQMWRDWDTTNEGHNNAIAAMGRCITDPEMRIDL